MTDIFENIGTEEKVEDIESEEQQMIEVLYNHALLIELDSIAFPEARKALFKSAVKHFKKCGIKLTDIDFLKYFMDQSLEDAISEVLEDDEKYETELAESIEKSIRSDYRSALKKAEVNPAFLKYIELAKKTDSQIGLLSALSEDIVIDILEGMGVKDNYKLVAEEEFSTIKRDGWLKLLKSMPVNPRGCVVLTSNSKLAVAALFAEVKYIIAVPDEFSKNADFTGTDFILDNLENEEVFSAVKELMDHE
jgi:beta-phosphoglucomutase-like phosphatase (HAD superfamily)